MWTGMNLTENNVGKQQAFPLAFLNEGESAVIVEFKKPANLQNSINNETYIRLDEMGIRSGRTIQMLNNSNSNSLLIKIDNSRLALPRKIAMKIYVRR